MTTAIRSKDTENTDIILGSVRISFPPSQLTVGKRRELLEKIKEVDDARIKQYEPTEEESAIFEIARDKKEREEVLSKDEQEEFNKAEKVYTDRVNKIVFDPFEYKFQILEIMIEVFGQKAKLNGKPIMDPSFVDNLVVEEFNAKMFKIFKRLNLNGDFFDPSKE